MRKYEFFITNSLEKVFSNKRPEIIDNSVSAFRGTRASAQLVYTAFTDSDSGVPRIKFELEFQNSPVKPILRTVELIPSDFPCWQNVDDNYLSKEAGLFPDLLLPLENPVISPLFNQYRALFITFDIPEDCKAGIYDIKLIIKPIADDILLNGHHVYADEWNAKEQSLSINLNISDAKLVPQTLIHTEWFHGDCLAEYYGIDVFCERHWQILENFMMSAVREHGINMILTPVFTPALDTAVGGERPTIQLVDVKIKDSSYEFGFDRLHKWLNMCNRCGIEYIEVAHLFTQWGAKACPKIIAQDQHGKEIKLFDWSTQASSGKYRQFLVQFIPALQQELNKFGYDNEHVYYHISDEPNKSNITDYLLAKNQVTDLLCGCHIVDALSDFDFYTKGIVNEPIVANDAIQPFIDASVANLWVYYCCAQRNKVPNRFFAMPSARNRIMGVLMYMNNIKGFLHWGYNFYYGQFSVNRIDPYKITHAEYAFPSGDGFLVYPAKDGKALSSIRAEVQFDALVDMRALQTLENIKGKEFVHNLVHSIMGNIQFDSYPAQAEKLLQLREAIVSRLQE